MNDRDGFTIRGHYVLHSTARRDYVCGECGGCLVTRWDETAPHWFTICAADATHDPDQFVKSTTWETQKALNTVEAEDVRMHLPADVRAMIEA